MRHRVISSGSVDNFIRTSSSATGSGHRDLHFGPAVMATNLMTSAHSESIGSGYPFASLPAISAEQTISRTGDPNILPCLWADEVYTNTVPGQLDVNMNLDASDINWYNWVESAKGLELEVGPSGDHREHHNG